MDRRHFLAAGGLAPIAALGLTAAPARAAAADPNGARPADGRPRNPTVTAGFLTVVLDGAGRVTALLDSRTGRDHLAPGTQVPLVSAVVDGRQDLPATVTTAPHDHRVLVFTGERSTIEVRTTAHPTHTVLEAVGVTAAPGADVQTLLWGPLPTTVDAVIGETAGVVRDDAFAIGLRPLNDKTVGGWPNEHLALGFGPDLVWNPYGLQTGDHDEWLASNVAAKTTWGSVLRATTYDYSRVRTRQRTTGYPIPLGPLPAPDGRIPGSRIALFGSAPDLALTVLGEIARAHGLPRPTLGGQWQKASQLTSRSHFWIHDLDETTAAAAARHAARAGVPHIYAISGDGPWQSHGHYRFNSAFGGTDEAAARLVATAEANGSQVGVHTLSDFIDADDPYVRAPADPRLAQGGSARLTRPLAAADTALHLDDAAPLAAGLDGRRLRIGDEILTYTATTRLGDAEWRVDGLARAQWGSTALDRPAGTTVARLQQNGYGGAIGGLGIIDEIATRLAGAYNATGIRATSYDGLESAGYTGWGGYGFARLVNGVHRQLDTEEFVTECSNLSSNTWDAQSRASWGEIGRTDYAQLLRSNTFYRANYLPGMMGQQEFSGDDTVQSVEDTMARAASQNAGINFETSVRSLDAGARTGALLDAVRTWEAARRTGAFTADQRARLGDPATHWHLAEVTPDQEWTLQPTDADGTPVGAPEPVRAPRPGFTTPAPPAARAGERYAFKTTSTTPLTVRYEITAGSLPPGLVLDPDTGGITGIPESPGSSRFTLTARSADGTADARITYRIATAPAA